MLTPAAACTKLCMLARPARTGFSPGRCPAKGSTGRHGGIAYAPVRRETVESATTPDFRALIVEDRVQSQGCAGFIGEVHGLGLTAPVVAISVKGAEPPLALGGADDYVVNSQSLVPDLAAARGPNLHRAKALTIKQPLRCLYLGDSALARRPGRATRDPDPWAESAIDQRRGSPSPSTRRRGQEFSAVSCSPKHGRARRHLCDFEGPDSPATPGSGHLRCRVGRSADCSRAQDGRDRLRSGQGRLRGIGVRIDRLRSGSILAREFDDLLRQQAELRASLDHATDARAARKSDWPTRRRPSRLPQSGTRPWYGPLRNCNSSKRNIRPSWRARPKPAALAEQLEDTTSALGQAREKQASGCCSRRSACAGKRS